MVDEQSLAQVATTPVLDTYLARADSIILGRWLRLASCARRSRETIRLLRYGAAKCRIHLTKRRVGFVGKPRIGIDVRRYAGVANPVLVDDCEGVNVRHFTNDGVRVQLSRPESWLGSGAISIASQWLASLADALDLCPDAKRHLRQECRSVERPWPRSPGSNPISLPGGEAFSRKSN